MAYTYATSPADVVVNEQTGLPRQGVRLTVWTAKDGMQITAGLRDLAENPLPGYVETDADGRFPFTDDAERPNALWALTPEGDWFSLVANELRDNVGQVLEEFPQVRQKAADAEQAVEEFRPRVAAATARSIEALQVAEQANQTASIVIEPEWPFIVAHRGGALIWPEESIEGTDDALRGGFGLEVDVRPLADGTLVLCHDTTVQRTMEGIGTGPVAEKTLAEWRAAFIKHPIQGGSLSRPLTFNEWLDMYGGQGLLVPELSPGASDEDVDRYVSAVLTRRLENSLIAQSFDLPVALKMAEAGLEVCFLASLATEVDLEALSSAGIKIIGTSLARPVADVQAWQAAGFKVLAYTVKTKAEQDTALATFDGVFSDDPHTTSGRVPSLRGGGPVTRAYGAAIYRTGGQANQLGPVKMLNGGLGVMESGNPGGEGVHHIPAPWAGLITRPARISADLYYGRGVNQLNNLGLTLLSGKDFADFVDGANPGQNGYTFALRRNGDIEGWEYVSGGAPSKVLDGDPLDPPVCSSIYREGRAAIVIVLTPTGIEFHAIWGPHTAAQSASITSLDGPFNLGLRFSGCYGSISNVSVTPL